MLLVFFSLAKPSTMRHYCQCVYDCIFALCSVSIEECCISVCWHHDRGV